MKNIYTSLFLCITLYLAFVNIVKLMITRLVWLKGKVTKLSNKAALCLQSLTIYCKTGQEGCTVISKVNGFIIDVCNKYLYCIKIPRKGG